MRNRERIREAATVVFRRSGMSTPLDEVAAEAGVSKGTIYHRFTSRAGLVDAVVETEIEHRFQRVFDDVMIIQDPGQRLTAYLTRMWQLEYDEPMVCDVLAQVCPDSTKMQHVCRLASELACRLLTDAQAQGAVRADLTPADLYHLLWSVAVALRQGPLPEQHDFLRRCQYQLDGIRWVISAVTAAPHDTRAGAPSPVRTSAKRAESSRECLTKVASIG